MKNRIKLLLLQARHDHDPMCQHEVECFVETTGIDASQFTVHDLTNGPPSVESAIEFDAIMVGGSGEFCISRADLPHQDRFFELLRELVDRGHPFFGSCFGYQALVQALGGEILHDVDNAEVGSFELQLTADGKADPLFGTAPASFSAQQGHKDRAVRHPEGMPNLVSSENSPFQAIAVPGKPMWATQFHPELSRESNTSRFRHYLDLYVDALGSDECADTLDGFRESPHASALLSRFIDLVFD